MLLLMLLLLQPMLVLVLILLMSVLVFRLVSCYCYCSWVALVLELVVCDDVALGFVIGSKRQSQTQPIRLNPNYLPSLPLQTPLFCSKSN